MPSLTIMLAPAGVAQLLPKHWAVGSNPITRSKLDIGSHIDFRCFCYGALYRKPEATHIDQATALIDQL